MCEHLEQCLAHCKCCRGVCSYMLLLLKREPMADDLTSHLNKAHPCTKPTVFLFHPRTRRLHSAKRRNRKHKNPNFATGYFWFSASSDSQSPLKNPWLVFSLIPVFCVQWPFHIVTTFSVHRIWNLKYIKGYSEKRVLNLRLCGFRDKGITLFNENEIPQRRGF